MTISAQRPLTRHPRRGPFPLLTGSAAVGCSTLLASAVMAGPAVGGTPSPSSTSSTSSASAVPSGTANQAPKLMTCGGVMTQAGDTESIRISVADPDGDSVTLSADVSMLGVQPTVSGHVITYPAPPTTTGQDNFVVTASDGRGGEAHCEVGVLVQAGAKTTPTPTPTPAPSTLATPASGPATPDPGPTPDGSTPTPAPESTGVTPAPEGPAAPTLTSRPLSAAPTTEPAAADDVSEEGTEMAHDTDSPAQAPGGNEGPGTPTSHGPNGGSHGVPRGTGDHSGETGSGASGADGSAPGSGTGEAGDPDGGTAVALSLRPDLGAGTGTSWADVVPTELGAGSLRTVAGAQQLLQGIDHSGQSAGGGGHPDTEDLEGARPATDRAQNAEARQARLERAADTGASGWLFAVVGALMTTLVGLALMALPRGRRQD